MNLYQERHFTKEANRVRIVVSEIAERIGASVDSLTTFLPVYSLYNAVSSEPRWIIVIGNSVPGGWVELSREVVSWKTCGPVHYIKYAILAESQK